MFAPSLFGVDLDKCIDNTDFLYELLRGYSPYNK